MFRLAPLALLLLALPLQPATAGETRQDPPKRESLQDFLRNLKSRQLGSSSQLRGGLETLL